MEITPCFLFNLPEHSYMHNQKLVKELSVAQYIISIFCDLLDIGTYAYFQIFCNMKLVSYSPR